MPRLFTLADPVFDAATMARLQAFRARHDPQFSLLGPHVTLEFGQTVWPVAEYNAAVGRIAERHPAFDLHLSSAQAWAGPVGGPHLFLIPSTGAAALIALHRQLAGALGIGAGPHPFEPHITIGRAADRAAADAALALLPAGIIGATARIDALVVGALDGDRFTHLHRFALQPTPESPCSTT